jgi:hypothetical protein
VKKLEIGGSGGGEGMVLLRDLAGKRAFRDEANAHAFYATSSPIGPCGGALIDFGRAIVLECYVPCKLPAGLELPYVPLAAQRRDRARHRPE